MRALFFSLFVFFTLYAKPYNEISLERLGERNQSSVFSFAVMGDNRDGEEVFKKIIEKIDKSAMAFALNNGDITSNGAKEEFVRYIDLLKNAKTPIISIIGNHEIPFFFGDKTNFERFIGKTDFSFSYANSYFIIVDDANKKRVKKKRMKWLEKELEKARKYTHRFVFLHVPLFDPREGKLAKGHSLKDTKNAYALLQLFRKYGVTMVFSSHIHAYFRGDWDGVPFIVTGGAGAPHSRDRGFFHFIRVDVENDKVRYILERL